MSIKIGRLKIGWRKSWPKLAFVLGVLFCWPSHQATAANTTWSADTSLFLSGSGITLTIVSGSQSDSLSITATTFTVSVAAGETFTIRYPGPDPGNLVNDASLSTCQYNAGNNIVAVSGGVAGATVTFTPATTPFCRAPGGGGGGAAISPPYVSLSAPNGGQSLRAGETYTIVWFAGGYEVSSARLSLSLNNGDSWSTIIASQPTSGTYSWIVPNVTSNQAKIKVEAMSGGGLVKATDISEANFSITGSIEVPAVEGDEAAGSTPDILFATPPEVDPSISGGYAPAVATAATPDIDTDLGLLPVSAGQSVYCQAGSLIKAYGFPAVYYCGRDGKRYVFVNERVFYSWFSDFSRLIEINSEEMARIPVGGNVTYRPGTRMVKIESDPRVYAVARGGLLRWIQTEEVARALYGPYWNRFVDDVSVAFWVSYRFGPPITRADVGL
jgi:hypothetical protein